MWLEVISRLKINLKNRELILVGLSVDVEDLARVLRCKVGTLLTSYLVLPLGAPFRFSRVGDMQRKYLKNGLLCEEDSTYQKGVGWGVEGEEINTNKNHSL